ncbi:MAG: tetratricopeptide repeat protein [Bacteroidaceae bacterium]|nr:tetratricopeptide repeat protein [Bacteroidaceae bacterium]
MDREKQTLAQAYYQLGNRFRQQQDWKRALEYYAEATALDPESPATKAAEILNNILDYRCKELINP